MTIPTLDPDPVPYVLSVDRADGRGTARIEGFLVPICLLNKQKKGPMWVIAAVPPPVLRDDLSWVADEIADEIRTKAAWHRVANAVGDWDGSVRHWVFHPAGLRAVTLNVWYV